MYRQLESLFPFGDVRAGDRELKKEEGIALETRRCVLEPESVKSRAGVSRDGHASAPSPAHSGVPSSSISQVGGGEGGGGGESERERETDRQTDRDRERQRDRQRGTSYE